MPTYAKLAYAAPDGRPATTAPVHDNDDAARRTPPRQAARPGLVLGRRATALWSCIVLLLLGWSTASTSYVLFRDQILQDIRRHHAAAERAAASQAAALREQIDRIKSAQMSERAALGEQIDALLKREAMLARRQAALGDFVQPGAAARGAIATLPKKPRPVDDTVELQAPVPPPQESRAALPGLKTDSAGSGASALATLKRGYDAIEVGQAAAVAHVQAKLDHERGALADLYHRLGVHEPAPPKDVGGPYIPASEGPLRGDPAFNRALGRVAAMQADIRRLKQGLVHLPVRSPLDTNELEETSGFGSRLDPFYHSLAFHPGLDLRAAVGSPVEATAAGKVVTAGWNGGYGNMVEIDHGNGVATRYGHLSAIEVKVGAHVAPGQEIGRVGSTGRSTGPHLHYEVRLDNEPVDPTRFLTATNHLASADDDASAD